MKRENIGYVKALIDAYEYTERELNTINKQLNSPENKGLTEPNYGSIEVGDHTIFLTSDDLEALIRVRRKKMDDLLEKMKDV